MRPHRKGFEPVSKFGTRSVIVVVLEVFAEDKVDAIGDTGQRGPTCLALAQECPLHFFFVEECSVGGEMFPAWAIESKNTPVFNWVRYAMAQGTMQCCLSEIHV